jgi:hypothetical protein
MPERRLVDSHVASCVAAKFLNVQTLHIVDSCLVHLRELGLLSYWDPESQTLPAREGPSKVL